ncbi:MAG: cytidine deaminase [Caldithrix sp.]|nr:cytidine deaminase [Caldithrix sp.]
MNATKERLIGAAKQARKFSQAKYSRFKVGAALLTNDNTIITGCNVESSSYGLTICAERVALTKALSEGYNQFTSITIFAKDGHFISPCGACRQLLFDYAPDIQVIMTDGHEVKEYPLKELLPLAFDDSNMD